MDFEKYAKLVKKGFSPQDINQIEKAIESGFDIYNPDIWIPSDKLREFRRSLSENLDPVFDHDQLREMLIGFLKEVDFLIYASPSYTSKQMGMLRKTLEDGKDIDILLNYSTNETEMKIIYDSIKFGLAKEDLDKYSHEQLEYIMKTLKSKKADPRPLLDKGYQEYQIEKIEYSRTHSPFIDIEPFITKEFTYQQIGLLNSCLKFNYLSTGPKFPEESFKIIFNKNFSTTQLEYIAGLIKSNHFDPEFIKPEYPVEKIRILLELKHQKEKKTIIENVKESDFSTFRYHQIGNFLRVNLEFKEMFLDKDIDDAYFRILTGNTKNLNAFEKYAKLKFDISAVDYLSSIEDDDPIIRYIYKGDSYRSIRLKEQILKYSKEHNLSSGEEFTIMHDIKNGDQFEHFKLCKQFGLDYRKVDIKLPVAKIKKLGYLMRDGVDITEFELEKLSLSQMETLGKAIKLNLPTKNILKCKEDYKLHVVLSIEKFNANNERQININELLAADTDTKTLGIITSYLISSNLDDNIKGYKLLEQLPKKEVEECIEKENPFYDENIDFY